MTAVVRLYQLYPPQAGHRRPGNDEFLHLLLSRPPHLGSKAIINSDFSALHSLRAAFTADNDAYSVHDCFSGKWINFEVMTKVQQAITLVLQRLPVDVFNVPSNTHSS